MHAIHPRDCESEQPGPRSYQDSHALGKRRLAAFLVKVCSKRHLELGHGLANPDLATHSNPMRHSWRLCQQQPCLHARLLLEECGCKHFMEILHETGSRAERRKRRRGRIKPTQAEDADDV